MTEKRPSIVEKLSEDIVEHVEEKLNEIYNHRKHKEGLVSIHNQLIYDFRRTLKGWHNKNIEESNRLDKVSEDFDKEFKFKNECKRNL